jgi:hypothetical protein
LGNNRRDQAVAPRSDQHRHRCASPPSNHERLPWLPGVHRQKEAVAWGTSSPTVRPRRHRWEGSGGGTPPVQPPLQGPRRGRIPGAQRLDPAAQFHDGQDAEKKILGRHGRKPSHHRRTPLRSSEFGNDVGVDEVALQQVTFRWRSRCRENGSAGSLADPWGMETRCSAIVPPRDFRPRRAFLKILRCCSSMETPTRAARRRNVPTTCSSMLRTTNWAMGITVQS